mmetsp:Transcript_40136/g.101557  ORF Transcript_40136/g.101557 Transcript_40136/m.101557 type:complete len:269 (-) Transcript_40136:154-960(-)
MAAAVGCGRLSHATRLAALLAAVCLAAAAADQTCPYDTHELKVSEGAPSKCVYLSDELHTFTECQEAVCGPRNATLVCVSSAEENAALGRWFGMQSALHPGEWGGWIGQYQEAHEGEWRWTSTCGSSYNSWHPGEPNNFCMDEDCTMISTRMWGLDWVDAACNMKAACICQTGTVLSPEYTEEATHELRLAGSDYSACKKEEELASRAATYFSIEVVLLLAILGSNVMLIGIALVMCRRQLRNRPTLAEQGLTEYLARHDSSLYEPLS